MMFEKTRFKPNGDRILVKIDTIEEKSFGGIIIPDTAREKERAQSGIVVAIGAGKRDAHGNRIPVEVKNGDRIYFGKFAGTEAGKDSDGGELMIIKEDEILGVIEG
jgi:chaperonin GroES